MVFKKEPLELEMFRDYDFSEENNQIPREFQVWSIELGIVRFTIKDNQTIFQGIVKTLNHLQKEDYPSHVIISEIVDGTSITRHTVYRLTEEQESEIFFNGIFPATEKRYKKMAERANAEQKAFEEEWKKYAEEIKDDSE